jgi:sec-independent protein translocase protein TatA
MKSLGAPEILIIALVILLLFGAKKLPELAKGLGEGIKNFKNSIKTEEEPKEKKQA